MRKFNLKHEGGGEFIFIPVPHDKDLAGMQLVSPPSKGSLVERSPASKSDREVERPPQSDTDEEGSSYCLNDPPPLPNRYELQANALVNRVHLYSTKFQRQHISTTLLMVAAMTSLLKRSPGLDIEQYWTEFGNRAEQEEMYFYVAARGLAGSPVEADLAARLEEAVPPFAMFISEDLAPSLLKGQKEFWQGATDALVSDWLYECAVECLSGTLTFSFALANVVSDALIFLRNDDVSKAMSSTLRFGKNFVVPLSRSQIHFLTQFVLVASNYGTLRVDLSVFPEEMARRILAWLISWHDQLAGTEARMLAESALLAEVGASITILCLSVPARVPTGVIDVANAALSRRTDCKVSAARPDCLYAVSRLTGDPNLESYQLTLALAHEACLLSVVHNLSPSGLSLE